MATAWSYDGVRHVYSTGTITTINNSEVHLKLGKWGDRHKPKSERGLSERGKREGGVFTLVITQTRHPL